MSLEQIGQKLKTAREVEGLSLKQIHERTKIPIGHLQAIESGQNDDLPEPVYVAGYIKRYAECVSLDGHQFSEEYRNAAQSNQEVVHHRWTKQAATASDYTAAEYLGRVKVDREPPTFKTIYFNAIWIVVIVGLISYLTMTQLNNQVNQQDPSLVALRETTSKLSLSANQRPASGAANNTIADTSETSDARISLSAAQHVWVEVKSVSTGESLYTGYLEQGERRDFQDSQGLRVRAGNGGSLTVDFQGKMEAIGEAGQVAERTFMARSATIAGASNKEEDKPITTVKPVTTVKKTSWRKAEEATGLEARHGRYRSIDDTAQRQYIPGESLGGTSRTIDVPYRYSEGRLDTE
ncbi:MAG: helix-turn-helix domain-containing protein [Candidatus Melainabacteria bacterium]|nr:helix-turn-helix domain-containing protein [Candidatus Melainabacteria bacterium]